MLFCLLFHFREHRPVQPAIVLPGRTVYGPAQERRTPHTAAKRRNTADSEGICPAEKHASKTRGAAGPPALNCGRLPEFSHAASTCSLNKADRRNTGTALPPGTSGICRTPHSLLFRIRTRRPAVCRRISADASGYSSPPFLPYR